MKRVLLIAIGIVGGVGGPFYPAVLLGEATIVYHQPAEVIVALSGVFQGYPGKQVFLDLDTNGVPDYVFEQAGIAVTVRPFGSNQQASVLATGRDLGSSLFALDAGVEVGPQLPMDVVWVDYLTPRHPMYPKSTVSACADIGCGGYFLGGIDYMGVNFQMADGFHYGWVRMESFTSDAGGMVLDWAYEIRPNTSIKAGASHVIVSLARPEVVRAGYLRLKWTGELAKTYQVQFKENLDAYYWTNLNFAIPATATNTAVDLPMTGTSRFLRVVQVD